MVTLVLLLLLNAAPLVEVAPSQVGDQGHARVGCDEAGCIISWIAQATTNSAWSASVSRVDGSVSAPVTTNDASRGGNVEGIGVGGGLRLHLLDSQGRAGDYTLYLALMRQGDDAIDARGSRAFSPHSGAGSPASSSCAFGSSLFFCVFESGAMYNDIYFRRVSLDGGALDSTGTELPTGINHAFGPAVVTMGDRFGTAWADRFDTNQYDVHGAVVSADGSPVAQAIVISSMPENEVDVASTTVGDEGLFAWTRETTPPEIRFALLSQDGGVTMPLGAMRNAATPAIVWQANRLFVAYERGSTVEAVVLGWPAGEVLSTPFVAEGARPIATAEDEGRVLLGYQVNSTDGGDTRLVVTSVCMTGCEGDAGVALADAGVELTPHWVRVGCDCGSAPSGLVFAALAVLFVRRRSA